MAKKKRRSFSGMLFTMVFLFICGYVLFTLYEQQKELNHLQLVETENVEKIQMMEAELSEMQEDINSANSDEHIEKHAREQLKMIGPNEVLFIDLGKGSK